VWFVPLAVVNEPQYVAETICQALEIPDSGLSPQIALQKHLRNKRVLLVLDNFEQLLEKKDEADAALLVAGLLKIASELKVIITSREALNLNGEHLYSVPQLTTKSAVELFVERAQATHADFNTEDAEISNIAEICRRLDHLPLAIELAAARARLFTPAQLLSRLPNRLDLLIDGARDLPARQRTLRNTIEWSYNLLSPEEQRLFRRLGVFAGTCYLGAIKHITCANLQTSEEDLLQSLTVKSLIKVEPGEGE
jgi:predicted ATPase